MWIRSQTKTILQKVDNLLISDGDNAKGTFNIYTNSLPAQNVLGEYKTKERALEVLDEIQRLITDLQYLNYAIKNDEFCSYRPNVYEMPEN